MKLCINHNLLKKQSDFYAINHYIIGHLTQ